MRRYPCFSMPVDVAEDMNYHSCSYSSYLLMAGEPVLGSRGLFIISAFSFIIRIEIRFGIQQLTFFRPLHSRRHTAGVRVSCSFAPLWLGQRRIARTAEGSLSVGIPESPTWPRRRILDFVGKFLFSESRLSFPFSLS